MQKIITAILTLLLIAGCTVGKGSGVFPPAADFNAKPSLSADDDGSDHRLLVANGLSETITLIERKSGAWQVTPDILDTGQAPNFMTIRGNTCYLVNSLSNSIQLIDINSLATTGEISTGPGSNPMQIEFIDDTTAIVTCYLSNEAVIIDLDPATPADVRITARIPMPTPDELPRDGDNVSYARPGGVAVIGNSAFVLCSNLSGYHVAGGPGVIVIIDLDTLEIESTIVLSGRDSISLLHPPRFPERLVALSAGDYDFESGFHGNGMVESIDLNTREIFQTIELDGAPFDGTIGPDDILFMENGKEGTVLCADIRNGSQLTGFDLPSSGLALSYASSIVTLPGLVAVTDFNSDRLYLIDPLSGDILAELATSDGPDAMVCVDFKD